ncbi:MAG: twin-arginine translocase subunit TatC [Chloroflexota bacterium]
MVEMRRRLVYSVIAVAITTAAAFVFADRIFAVLLRPIGDVQVVFTQVTEMLGTYFTLSLTIGLAAALPFILLQVVWFVSPALYPREKLLVYSMVPAALVAFAAGAAFGYLVLLPPALKFLLGFGADIAAPFIKVGSYISLVTRLLFWIGVAFETPVVVFLLAKVGIVTARALLRKWRLAVVCAFILGAMITPTFDPVNQSLVALPLVALYGISIGLAYFAQVGRRKRPRQVGAAEQAVE